MPEGESKATRNRKARAKVIEEEGYSVMPCNYCSKHKVKCWAKEGYDKCAQCTRRGRPCDGKGMTLVAAEKRRLEREEEVAENDLIELQRQVNERLARLMRLRRQKRQLQERAEEMTRRDVETLDDLEALGTIKRRLIVNRPPKWRISLNF
ncbi:hypothetical protein QX201_007695 [Fusarium graminearum]